jgi:hypothetical protein
VFEIKNLGKTALMFHAGHRLASVPAGAAKSFDIEAVGAGVLRMFNADPLIKVKAKTDEAEAKLHEALTAPRKRGRAFNMVHGSGDRSAEEVFAAETKNRVRQVRDEKNPDKGFDKGRFITDPANPNLPDPNDPQPQSQDETPPGAPPEGQDAAPPPAVVEHEEQKELTPAQLLLADENNPDVDLPLKELKRRAKEILGDDYPSGNVGRDDIVSALQPKV